MMKLISGKQLLVLLASLACAGCGEAAGTAAPVPSDSGRLVSTVTKYTKDVETGEWTVVVQEEYRYENGYPVSMTRTESGFDTSSEYTFSYTFENGIPVSMEKYDPQSNQTSRTEYNEGRVWRVESFDPQGLFRSEKQFQYGIGGPFFTDVLHVSHEKSTDGTALSTMEEIDAVSVYTDNGLLTKTVNSGLYANWNEGDEKEWMRFNGTYAVEYENGIASHTSAEYRAGPSGMESRFEVKRENGLVSEVIRSDTMNGQDPAEQEKVVFTYTDIEIDNARYTSMINCFILDGGQTFYIYNWY